MSYCQLIKKSGAVKIKIGDKIFDPLAFKSFRPTKKNIQDFLAKRLDFFCIFGYNTRTF